MQKSVISREESERLESAVRELIMRSSRGEPSDSLYAYVRKHTEILFYELPRRMFLLHEDDCADFLLSQKQHIDKIIYSYRIVRGCSYIGYITNSIKLRSMVFSKRKSQKELLDLSVSWSCVHENPVYYNTGGHIGHSAAENRPQSDDDFKEVFKGIISHTPAESPDPIKKFLQKDINRRNMLLYIISEQDDLSITEQKELASIFNTPECMMAALSFCMHTHRDLKREDVAMRREQNISRSWVRYLAITTAIEREDNPEKKAQLEIQQQKTLRRLRKLQAEYQKRKRGMAYRDISANLEVSVGTVVHGIHSVRNFLQAINGTDEEA